MSEIVYTHINTSSGSGATSNSLVVTYSALIPRDTFTASDNVVLEVQTRVIKSETLAPAVFRVYLNTTNSLTGAVQIGNYGIPTPANFLFRQGRRFFTINNNRLGAAPFSLSYPVDYYRTTSSVSSTTYNTSSDYYILISVSYGTTGTRTPLYGTFLKILAYK